MELINRYFKSYDELKEFIQSKEPVLFVSSQTSTVIPYPLLEERLASWCEKQGIEKLVLGDLTSMPSNMELLDNGNLYIKGSVNWEEAIAFCQKHGRTIKTYPTEQLACIPAGVATSATGERCFGFGTLREQVISLKFMDGEGTIHTLQKKNPLEPFPELQAYQEAYLPYQALKNGPFPRLKVETDLVIGAEGQLGPILEVELETTPYEEVRYFFIHLPCWEEDDTPHLELFQKVQAFRGNVLSCEILDKHSMQLLPEQDRLKQDRDIIFLEIRGEEEAFDDVFENLLFGFESIDDEWIFEIPEERFHQIRAGVPRAIFENNQRLGVEKKGSDVQVRQENFKDLLAFYRKGKDVGLPYFLFGHFGDAHLHYNFTPKTSQVELCNIYFKGLYDRVLKWKGSPFAEHGIGLIKQRYIRNFHSETQYKVFKALKTKYDPNNIFFPMGFMSGPFEGDFSD